MVTFFNASTHLSNSKRVHPCARRSVGDAFFFNEPIMWENGRKWLGKHTKCSKLVKKTSKLSQNVPRCSIETHYCPNSLVLMHLRIFVTGCVDLSVRWFIQGPIIHFILGEPRMGKQNTLAIPLWHSTTTKLCPKFKLKKLEKIWQSRSDVQNHSILTMPKLESDVHKNSILAMPKFGPVFTSKDCVQLMAENYKGNCAVSIYALTYISTIFIKICSNHTTSFFKDFFSPC